MLLGKDSRKYAIFTLNREGKREYKKYYDGEVAAAVITLWRFFWYIAGSGWFPWGGPTSTP